jgi:hypothetical protein
VSVVIEAHLEVEEELVRLLDQVGALEALQYAMEDYAEQVLPAGWMKVADDRGVRGNYLHGIQPGTVERLPATTNAMLFGIRVENTWKRAVFVDDGRMAFHLPSRINWAGPKVKHGKKGPYLHIPFGHAAFATEKQLEADGATVQTRRSMMPADLYAQAKKLRPRVPQEAGPQYDAQGRYKQADLYAWGGKPGQATRIRHDATGTVAGPGGPGDQQWRGRTVVAGRIRGQAVVNPAWSSSKYDGMFKSTGNGHTKYLTIRTITPNSQGWHIPAMPGLGIARAVTADLRAHAQSDFATLLESKLRAML